MYSAGSHRNPLIAYLIKYLLNVTSSSMFKMNGVKTWQCKMPMGHTSGELLNNLGSESHFPENMLSSLDCPQWHLTVRPATYCKCN